MFSVVRVVSLTCSNGQLQLEQITEAHRLQINKSIVFIYGLLIKQSSFFTCFNMDGDGVEVYRHAKKANTQSTCLTEQAWSINHLLIMAKEHYFSCGTQAGNWRTK